jgi:hypothetical protein
VRRGGRELDASTFVIVFLFLLLLVPSRLVVGPIGAAGTPAALWGIAGLFWWILARVGGLVDRDLSPFRWAVGLFVITVLISYAAGMTSGWYSPANVHQVTDDVYDLVQPNAEALRAKMMLAADRGLLGVASWAGIALVCADGLRSWLAIDRVVMWAVRLAAAIGVLGILQFFTGFNIEEYIRIPGLVGNSDVGQVIERSVLVRVSVTASHPIEYGVVVAALFPVALHRALTKPSLLRWAMCAVVGVAAMLSVSRSAVLSIGIALVILFIGWRPAWRWRALFVFPVAVVALRVLIPGLVGTIMSLWRNLFGDPSTTGRTDDYAIAGGILMDHLFVGRGLFTFVPRYYRIMDNQLFVALIELGLVGFIALLGLFAVGFFSARGARRRALSFEHQHLGLALSGAIAGTVATFATFDAFGFPMVAGVTFVLLGLAGAMWQVARAEQKVGGTGPTQALRRVPRRDAALVAP